MCPGYHLDHSGQEGNWNLCLLDQTTTHVCSIYLCFFFAASGTKRTLQYWFGLAMLACQLTHHLSKPLTAIWDKVGRGSQLVHELHQWGFGAMFMPDSFDEPSWARTPEAGTCQLALYRAHSEGVMVVVEMVGGLLALYRSSHTSTTVHQQCRNQQRTSYLDPPLPYVTATII